VQYPAFAPAIADLSKASWEADSSSGRSAMPVRCLAATSRCGTTDNFQKIP